MPIILATFPRLTGLPPSETIFDIVFFVVLTSVLVQGAPVSLVARWLGVLALPQVHRPTLELTADDQLKSALVELVIPLGSAGGRPAPAISPIGLLRLRAYGLRRRCQEERSWAQ